MSHLSNELAAILKQNGLKQTPIAAKIGMGAANISRIFSGRQAFVTSEDLDKIIGAVAKSPQDRAKLVRARMRDAYNGKDAGLVNITIRGGASPSQRFTPSDVSIDPDVNAAFEYLYRLVPSNPEIGDLMILQARAMGRKR